MALDPDTIAAVTRASGNLPADGQMAAANAGNGMEDAINQAQSIAAYGDATTQVNHLTQLPKDKQVNAWNGATTADRQLWMGAGYIDPTGSHRGWFSRAVHDVFGAPSAVVRQAERIPVAGQAVSDVTGAIGTGVHDTLNALGAGVRYTQHAFRAGEDQYLNQVGNNGALNNPLGRVLGGTLEGAIELVAGPVDHFLGRQHADSWADAWEKTTTGEQTFDPNKDRDIQQSSGLSSDQITLAKAAAGGDEYLTRYFENLKSQGMDDAQIVDIENQLTDPSGHFQHVVQQYKDSKMSIGRALIPSFMYHSTGGRIAANIISGAGDAAFDFFADPTIIAGKINKVAKIAKYGFRAPEEVAALLDKKPAVNWMKDVSSYLAKDDYAGLNQRYPNLIGINDALKNQNIKTVDQLKEAMIPGKTTDAQIAAAKGSEDATSHLQSLEETLPKDEEGNVVIEPGSEAETALKHALDQVGLTQAAKDDAMKEWLQDNIIANHILTGHGSAVNHGTQLVPTLTATGKAFLDAKGIATKAIDWSRQVGVDVGEDGAQTMTKNPVSGVVRLLGNTAHKAVTLLPDSHSLDPTSPTSNLDIQRFAEMYLPRSTANTLMNRWVQAGTDIGAKRNVYIDILANTFKAAGIDESSSIYRHYISDMEQQLRTQRYSAGGNDIVKTDNGMDSTAGILDQHLTTQWSLPAFKDLAAEQQRNAFMGMMYKVGNNRGVDLLSNIWKPAQLLRVGFPIRVAIEELAGTVAREGPLNVAKSAMAARRLRQAGQGVAEARRGGPLKGLFSPLKDAAENKIADPITESLTRYLGELPQSVQDRITNVKELQAAVLAQRTKRALSGAVLTGVNKSRNGAGMTAQKLLNTDDLENTIMRYPELFEHGLPSEITSIHGHQLGYQETNPVDLVKSGTNEDRLNFAPTMKVGPNGKYKEYHGSDDGFLSAWQKQLNDIASSTNTHTILENIHDDPTELRQKVADFLQSDAYKDKWNLAARSQRLSDGRVVGIDATARDAALDWADHLMNHVNHLLRDSDGNLHEDVYNELMEKGNIESFHSLMKVDKDVRPSSVVGPEFVQLPGGKAEGMIREFAERGFARMGRAIDYMSRQPMYVTAVHKADADIRPFIEGIFGEGTEMSKELTSTLVRERAAAETTAYIHNPRIRSQMNILTQNLAPFQFAQEQFWKRWARTFTQSPEAIREAQLAHHALGATGITHTDDSGQEIFTYPASGFVQKVLADGFQAIGIPAALPVADQFTGQLKMVAPGMDRTFAPSVGPFVSIPLSFAARHVRELEPAEQKILGPEGANKPLWEQYVPSSVARVVNATIANDQINPSYANAQMKTIQDLYATGNGLPPNASAEEQEKFMRRVKNYTRINMFARAMLGFGAPAAPQAQIGNTEFAHRLRTLANAGLNYSQAMQQMIKDDPDAYPYSIFMSEGAGSQPLPATKAADDALMANRGFFTNYAQAGGYFLPEQSKDDTFSTEAYHEQLSEQMRRRRMPDEFLEQLMYKQASAVYYDTRDDYNKTAATLSGGAKQELAHNYSLWKQQYLTEHPVFAKVLQDPTAHNKRDQTLTQVQQALNDPRAPDTPQVADIRVLIDTYNLFQHDLSQYQGMTTGAATRARKSMTENFVAWYKNKYLPDHPNGATLYNSLLKSDLEGNNENG